MLLILLCLLAGCQNKAQTEFQGYVEGELVYLAAPFSGKLMTLNVLPGDIVKKDFLIYTLDPEPEISQLATAKHQLSEASANLTNLIKGQRETIIEGILAQIDQNKADLSLSLNRVNRFEQLYKKNAIDKDTLDAAISTYQSNIAKLEQSKANLAEAELGSREDLINAQRETVAAAEANLREAKWALDQKSIFAPTDAIIFDNFYWPGEWVNTGQAVVALLAPQYVRFIFFVPEPILNKIRLGESVTISCDSCEKSYTATIDFISPQAEYTPPVIYSRDNNYNLVYRIKAIPKLSDAYLFHPGQPVYILLPQNVDIP